MGYQKVQQYAELFYFYYMVFLYAIKNNINTEIYVGISDNITRRIKEHNSGKNRYTKAFMPWEVFYQEVFSDYATARKREIYFKNASGKKFLKNILQQSSNTVSLPA